LHGRWRAGLSGWRSTWCVEQRSDRRGGRHDRERAQAPETAGAFERVDRKGAREQRGPAKGGATARKQAGPTRPAEPVTAPRAVGEKVRVFVSHASEDVTYLIEFEKHLALLEKSAAIDVWHRGRALAGDSIESEVDDRLEKAGLVLLLVSADFLSSEVCSNEVRHALARRDEGGGRGVVVVPILVRPVGPLAGLPIGELQALPKNSKAIAQWPDRDEAWVDVVEGVRQLLASAR
jgi:hypothetical protein